MDELILRKDALDALLSVVKTNSIQYVPLYARRALKNIPAADAVLVVHGYWKHFSRSDDCSECGYSTGKYESPSPYCPNCGAKMDGKPKEG